MNAISLARGLVSVSPSRIREIADIAFSMEGVLKLHFGESNIPTPAFYTPAYRGKCPSPETANATPPIIRQSKRPSPRERA